MSKWSSSSPKWFPEESWELHQSAANLTQYACIVSSRHIRDVGMRARFNRQVTLYARQLLLDVRDAKVSVEDALKAIALEHGYLIERSVTIGRQGLGLVAGTYQLVGGVSLCATGSGCIIGLPLTLHGTNNIYENFENLRTGRDDTVGPVRALYQQGATALGGKPSHGNMAYFGTDIGLSVHGLLKKVRRPGRWKLFKYIDSDFMRAYQGMSKFSLWTDVGADASTLEQAYQESKK